MRLEGTIWKNTIFFSNNFLINFNLIFNNKEINRNGTIERMVAIVTETSLNSLLNWAIISHVLWHLGYNKHTLTLHVKSSVPGYSLLQIIENFTNCTTTKIRHLSDMSDLYRCFADGTIILNNYKVKKS